MLCSTGQFFGQAGGGSPPAPMAYSYEGMTNDDTNASSYSFSGASIGAANASRVIAVAVITATGTPRTVSSVTLAGNAMTKGPEAVAGTSNQGCAAWFYLPVSSGTTATIAVTLSGVANSCAIVVYRLLPVSSTPIDTASASGAPASSPLTDLEVKTSGLALIAGIGGSGLTLTWNGADTPVHDLTNGANDSSRPTQAWSIPTTENNTTRDATFATGTFASVVGITFQ
ncbi:hypothetical protein [Mesorhizobium sp.]|uniref:hypothetical protein n=2 Tax=Mesorhizobium sp. TaxID=1871066 RepID=UPI0012028C8D|nr:hypothetical protein [Mesorhizobium sp.]TIQ99504.1 MAG: hypothetical protein E5X36_08985 [Mesorhizobium sp.]